MDGVSDDTISYKTIRLNSGTYNIKGESDKGVENEILKHDTNEVFSSG